MMAVRSPLAGLLFAVSAWSGLVGPVWGQSRPRMPTGPAHSFNPAALVLIPKELRDTVAKVTRQPTLSAHAGTEEFVTKPEMYRWLLDHPAQVSKAWHRLGIVCTDITDQGNGRSAWRDSNGSQLIWRTVWQGPTGRIWYAEGHAKPSPLLPAVPVKAVAVLQHTLAEEGDDSGRVVVRHQVDVFLQTDSKAAGLVMRMLGSSGPRMAESGAGQLLLFFSLMARHLDRHPEQIEALFGPSTGPMR